MRAKELNVGIRMLEKRDDETPRMGMLLDLE
jgi:hypothetical protein